MYLRNMVYSMNKDEGSKRIYRQPINYENGIILPLIRDCCIARANNPKQYQTNVQTLSIVMPKELRKQSLQFFKGNIAQEDLTMDGKKDIDDLFVYNLVLLEDHNICFPKLSFQEGEL